MTITLTKIVGIFAFTFIAVLGASVDLAFAADIDWKYYGAVTSDGVSQYCFYDANGVVKQADGHLRVWTKCLPQKEMTSIDIKKDFDGKIVENLAQKVYQHYQPPITTAIKNLTSDQIIEIISSEEIADIGNIQPTSQILYELNCPQMMWRELSISTEENGKFGSSDKPRDWKYLPPGGNAASLAKILCPSR
jgi:hypothetical protein